MSATHHVGSTLATVLATAGAVVCMIITLAMQARIGNSAPLAALIALGFGASLGGASGGFVLARRRRNMLWLLAMAISLTAMLILLALVLSSLVPD